MVRQYSHKDYDTPSFVRTAHIVSSVRVFESPSHHHLVVFSRGGNAGEITVDAKDGAAFLDMLLPADIRKEWKDEG